MEDEDGEGSNVDSWPVSEPLSYKETLKRPHNISNDDYLDGVEENHDDNTNSKVIFKGFKKRILAQSQDNQINDKLNNQELCPATSPKSSSRDKSIDGKCGKITEYAQYLGLQPAGKYKCPKCNPAVTFRSMSMLKQHLIQCLCQSSSQSSQCQPGTSELHGPSNLSSSSSSSDTNNFRITRKVYLCSACGTYFENWNLFLHMREIHQRHICLFCLGMFGQADRLSHHLVKKHSVPETHFNTADDFYSVFKGSCYLICCTCEIVFSETDNFYNHHCIPTIEKTSTSEVCSVCRKVDGHLVTCQLATDLQRGTIINNRIQASDSEQTLFPNPANAVAKKLLGAARERLKSSGEKATLTSYQRIFNNMLERKMNFKAQKRNSDNDDSDNEDMVRPIKDKVSNTDLETLKFNRDFEKNRLNTPESIAERQIVEIDMTNSPAYDKSRERYTDTIMQVSRCSEDSDTNSESRIEEIERINSFDDTPEEMEQGELILDDGTDVSSIESLPNHSPSRSPPTPSPEPQEIQQTTPVTADETTKLNSSNVTVDEEIHPEADAIAAAQHEVDEDEDEEEEEITPEPIKESQNISVSRVNSTNRSLVIKICTNKNSQFSVATPNGNGSYSNDEEDDNNDEDAESEENNNAGSEKEAEASDAESGKLAVASDHEEPTDEQSAPPPPPPQEPVEKVTEAEPSLELPVTSAPSEPMTTEPIVEDNPPISPLNITPDVPLEDQSVDEKPVDAPVEPPPTPPPAATTTTTRETDGIILAAEDIPSIDLTVSGTLDSMEVEDLLKLCIEIASPTCVYCNHARHIAVNGKQLALHMLAQHRFQPQHPAIIIQREQFIMRLKKSLDELEARYFNLDSYDNTRGTYALPEKRTYECYHCRIYYSVHKDLYLHNRKLHQKTILICIMCKSTFYNHSELLCHLCPGVYAANVNIRYRCCLCSAESLPSAFRLMVHLRKRHHACDVCLESTGNQQKLSNHVWKHKLHHLCYRCGIAYRNKPDITKHLFWKHGTESVMCKKCLQKKWPHIYHFCIPPSAFVCEECGSSFSRAVALKVHKRMHTGDEPYACPECPEKFISKKLLVKHEDTHKPQPELPPSTVAAVTAAVAEGTEDEIIDPGEPLRPANNVESLETESCVDVSTPKVPKEPVRKVVDVYDLPPLNLSSDSDSDSEDEKPKEKKDENMEEQLKKNEEASKKDDETNDNSEEKIEIVSEEIPMEVLPEVNDEEETKKEEVVIMNGIWDNFKSYTASLETCESSTKPEVDPAQNEEIIKNIIAEHDYCVIYENDSKESKEAEEEESTQNEVDVETKATVSPSTPAATTNSDNESKKTVKSPKKKKHSSGEGAASSSSSDSSSDSDSSSCSCGTNCSCSSSSSGSSSSSSSSSDSDSSSSETSPKKSPRKDRRKDREIRNKSKTKDSPEIVETQTEVQPENGVVAIEIKTPEAPLNVTEVSDKSLPLPLPVRESDLDTDETETDEDFYDEYPQQHANKILAEKRNQLLLLATVAPPSADDSALGSSSNDIKNGAIETTSEMTNSLAIPAVAPVIPSPVKPPRRKIKTKRRKKGDGRGRPRHPAPPAQVIPPLVVDPIKLNIPKLSYKKRKPGRPSTKNLKNVYQPKPAEIPTYYMPQNDHTAPQTPTIGKYVSGNESSSTINENKRSSKRKRVPKKFYGDSSDDEQQQQQQQLQQQQQFQLQQQLPQTLTNKWRRADDYIPAAPYIPTITIKQNYGPPPPAAVAPAVVQPKVYHTVPINPEPEAAPAPSVTDSDDAADSSSDSSTSENEQEPASIAPTPARTHPSTLNSEGGTTSGPPANRPTNLYCYCQCPYDEVSEMIACDGNNCRIEWFHFECVDIMVPPKGKWYCPDCRKGDSTLPNNEYFD